MVLREQDGIGETGTVEKGLVAPTRKYKRTSGKLSKSPKNYEPQTLIVKDETVDKLVAYQSTLPEGAGRHWEPEMRTLRDAYCIGLITEKGYTKAYARKIVQRQFGISQQTAQEWINSAMGTLTLIRTPEEREKIAMLFNERLEEVYSRAMELNKLDTAIKAIESQSKILGIYNDQIQNNTQVIYEFKFGE